MVSEKKASFELYASTSRFIRRKAAPSVLSGTQAHLFTRSDGKRVTFFFTQFRNFFRCCIVFWDSVIK